RLVRRQGEERQGGPQHPRRDSPHHDRAPGEKGRDQIIRMAKETAQKNNETKAEPRRSRLSGVVVSAKMKDTVVVRVDRYVKHAKYHKFMTRSTRIKAHDKGNTKKE